MAANGNFSIEAAMSGRSESFDLLRSVLLMARMTFDASLGRSLRTSRSAGFQPRDSITKTIASTSPSVERTVRFMRRMSWLPTFVWNPGVSMKTIWASGSVTTPSTRSRVVCGFFEVIETFSPIRWLIRVDLPTFGRPMTAT